MLFNSYSFIPFLLVVLGLYYCLPFRLQNLMLLVASCVFYGSWDWRFLILLLISTSIDFFVGQSIHDSTHVANRKWLLGFSCAANMGILCFFKYFNFFADSAAGALNWLGFSVPTAHLNVILPVGISFYTFHAMSYTIDIYRRKMTPISSFWDYMLFVLYFPQLVAGPIARASSLIPQIVHPRVIRADLVIQGLWLFFWGLIKKMVIADNLAPMVNGVFNDVDSATGLQCLLAIYGFAIQIYCDFSGYTDIARGLAKVMGIELALNFNLPYVARNPVEFWNRWHISLSTWLRDYLYIPLGGNRHGRLKTYRNLIVTMLLGGLWHGAAWHFVLWGAYHGLLLVIHRLWTEWRGQRTEEPPTLSFKDAASIFFMFHLTCLGWLLFRADDLNQIGRFIGKIFTQFSVNPHAAHALALLAVFAGILYAVDGWIQNAEDPRLRPGWNRGLGPVAVTVLALIWICLSSAQSQEFIYFQF